MKELEQSVHMGPDCCFKAKYTFKHYWLFTDNCIEMIKTTVGLAGYDTINVTEINNSVLTLMSY